MIKSRISILDGFRALAIISVVLFHYFSRWTPPKSIESLYPYHNNYDYFNYGYLGVQFFFIISGFVIFFTLENTSTFSSFWKKRVIRLLPSIVFASVITYTIFCLFDPTNLFAPSHFIKNFIPSLTFISPELLNNIFTSYNLDYINGSYWSLWPEIQFYVLSSIIFFINKERFIRNFLIVSITLICINYIIIDFCNVMDIVLQPDFKNWYSKWIQKSVNFIPFLPFFTIGMLFYLLFKNKNSKTQTPISIKTCLVVLIYFCFHTAGSSIEKLIYISMFVLFFCFIYFPNRLTFFENKATTSIGESSYFLYLIHENLGMLIIYSFGQYFLPWGFILPLLLIVGFIVLSKFFTKYIDKKISKWLKEKFIYE